MKTNMLLAATVAAFVSVSAYAQTVDEIVDKHVTAIGGLDKLNGVKTIAMEQSLSVQGMDIQSKSTIVRGKALRSESSVMGNSMVQVVNGTTGWMIRPTMMGGTGEPEDMPAPILKQTSGQLDPFGTLVDYKSKGYTIELVGKEKLDKKDVYHLKVTGKDGVPFDEWLNADTYLATKVKRTIDGQASEVEFEDYQDVQGIKLPKTMNIVSQMGSVTLTTEKVTLNAPVDEAIFKRPGK